MRGRNSTLNVGVESGYHSIGNRTQKEWISDGRANSISKHRPINESVISKRCRVQTVHRDRKRTLDNIMVRIRQGIKDTRRVSRQTKRKNKIEYVVDSSRISN